MSQHGLMPHLKGHGFLFGRQSQASYDSSRFSSGRLMMFAAVFASGLFFGVLFHRSGNLWIVGIFHGIGDIYITGLGQLTN